MSEADEIKELRAEVAQLKESAKYNQSMQTAFNDLYAIVTVEYEKWDEGRTVDWEALQHSCSLMVSAIRRGSLGY